MIRVLTLCFLYDMPLLEREEADYEHPKKAKLIKLAKGRKAKIGSALNQVGMKD